MTVANRLLTDNCPECLFKGICNQSVSVSEFEFIFQSTTQQIYKKGEVILKQGMKSNYLVYLSKGIVKFNYEDENRKNLILAISKHPSLLGLANLLNEDINIFSIIAVEECKGCLIDLNKLKISVLNNKTFMFNILKMSTDMFRSSIFNFISLAHKQVNGRLADILLNLSRNVYESKSFTLSVSRQELAEFAGCSKEIVIRTLREFDNDKIISLKGKKIVILDEDRLHRISRAG
jgi:CRP/FNR family transcriptional regulator